VRLVAPDRLQIREGGGCLSAFGLPFFGAGIFMMLSGLGIVPMSNDGEVTPAGPGSCWAQWASSSRSSEVAWCSDEAGPPSIRPIIS
jgi:hypothetical protein